MEDYRMKIHYIIQVPKDYSSDAAYNRIKLFADGFKLMNIQCEIHKIKTDKIKGKCSLMYYFIKNYLFLLSLLIRFNKKCIVVFYGEHLFFSLFRLYAWKTNLVIERNEYPNSLIIQGRQSLVTKYISLQFVKHLKYASAFVTCSSYLKKYYAQFLYQQNIIISPLIVDTDSFLVSSKVSNIEKRIVYCGSFNNNKDGVPILIKAFAQIQNMIPEYTLHLIGGGTYDNEKDIKDLIEALGIKNKVCLVGILPHNKVVEYYSTASILVLARPNNKQAEGGMPSKVAEYLSSGVPSVLTNVGDLSEYFKDGYNCYLAKPSSINSFAEKIIECVNSDNTQLVINALETAKLFDYKSQSALLYNSFGEIYNF